MAGNTRSDGRRSLPYGLMNHALGTVLTIAAIAGAGGRASLAEVHVVMSSQDGSRQLTDAVPLSVGSIRPTDRPTICIDLQQRGQAILGLGASFDHATCENLAKLPPEEREAVIEKLMDPEQGIGMNLMRVCIGTSDFVGEPYYTNCWTTGRCGTTSTISCTGSL